MKIVICYVGGSNLGDGVIAECTRFLLNGAMTELGVSAEFVDLDIGQQPKPTAPTTHTRWQEWILRKLHYRTPVLHSRLLWRWSAARREYITRELVKLHGADLIVFAGGGIIKFRKQKFHRHLDDITAWATRHSVPVLFNSVGVEGYDGKDLRCLILKQAINRRCVKMMTTRDDASRLAGDYVPDSGFKVSRVADPALWTPIAFGIARNAAEPKVIGINVIRAEIFGEYLYSVETESLMALYTGVAEAVAARGFKVELFTNGGNRDGRFLEELVKKHPEMAANRSVSVFRPVDARDLVRRISQYERLLATRLHAAIIATSFGVPNVSLVWSDKQLFFGEAVGMRGNFLKLEDFSVDAVCNRLFAAEPYRMDEDYRDTVRKTLSDAVAEIVRRH